MTLKSGLLAAEKSAMIPAPLMYLFSHFKFSKQYNLHYCSNTGSTLFYSPLTHVHYILCIYYINYYSYIYNITIVIYKKCTF